MSADVSQALRQSASGSIVVDGVRKVFRRGATVALEACSLEIAAHELLCIIGPSGCGKTTLLRIIDGLIRPDSGRVLVGGEEVAGPRRDVAMVFQHFGLFPWKTVYHNIAYGLRTQGRPADEIQKVVPHYIGLIGLSGFEHTYPYQLSGGMQQRVGLARALAINPSVLLMDEPFGSLDAHTRELMQVELLRLWRMQPKTLVFVTHSIDEAVLLGSRIAVMSGRPGRITEILDVNIPRPRDPDTLRRSPQYLALRSHIWDRLKHDTPPPRPAIQDGAGRPGGDAAGRTSS
jgi:NitT/TauT family transport system ATP-binding protein